MGDFVNIFHCSSLFFVRSSSFLGIQSVSSQNRTFQFILCALSGPTTRFAIAITKGEKIVRDATPSYRRKRKLQRAKGGMGTNGVVLTHAAHGNDVVGSVSDDDQKKQ